MPSSQPVNSLRKALCAPLSSQRARCACPAKEGRGGKSPELYTRPGCGCAQAAWPDGNYHPIIRSVHSKGLVCVCVCIVCLSRMPKPYVVPGESYAPSAPCCGCFGGMASAGGGGETCKENKTVWCAKRDLATQCNNYQKRNALVRPKSNECRMYVETGGPMVNGGLCASRTVLTSPAPRLPRQVGAALCLPRRGLAPNLGQRRAARVSVDPATASVVSNRLRPGAVLLLDTYGGPRA